jgi:hypothetical protein
MCLKLQPQNVVVQFALKKFGEGIEYLGKFIKFQNSAQNYRYYFESSQSD